MRIAALENQDPTSAARAPCTCITCPAEVGDVPTVQKLLQEGGHNVNARLPVSTRTPLHLACVQGSVMIVQMLLAAGADVEAETGGTQGCCTSNQLVHHLH